MLLKVSTLKTGKKSKCLWVTQLRKYIVKEWWGTREFVYLKKQINFWNRLKFPNKNPILRKFQGIFWWHSRTCPAVWSEACSLKVWTIERYFSMLKLGESDHWKPNSFSESLEISKQRSDIRKLWKNLSVENLWKVLTAGHKLFETMPDSV